MKKNTFLAGFTLIELLVVVVILGILLSAAIPRFSVFIERARQQEGINFLSHVHASQLRFFYESEPQQWPSSAAELDIEINPLKYFDENDLFLDGINGTAQLPREDMTGQWEYTLQINANGTFSYYASVLGPGGLPKSQ